MLSKTVALLSAASTVSALCAYPPPIGNQSGGNSVTRPDGLNPATIGAPFQIIWDATGWESTVDIHLLKGPGNNIMLHSTLATGVANTGSFTWTPPCDFQPATTGWGLMIVSEPSCSFQWSTQFGFAAAAPGVCASSSIPTQSSTSSAHSSVNSSQSNTSSAPVQSTTSAAPSSVISRSSSSASGNPSGQPTANPTGGNGSRPTGGNGPNPSANPGTPGNPGYVPGLDSKANQNTPGYVCPYSGQANCTSTSTVWVKPTANPSAVPGNGTTGGYKPLYANAAATHGMGMFTAIAAVAAAFLAC